MKSLYFSIFGGNLYECSETDESVLDAFQIPLKKSPTSSCKKCHGSFYVGFDSIKRHYIICPSCARKCLDIDKVLAKRPDKTKSSNTNERI